MNKSVIIIGGGASGLAAAVNISYCGDFKVTVIEKADRVGRKLSITGNGQGNISNGDLSLTHFHSADTGAAEKITGANLSGVKPFFEKIGLIITEENNGRIYPYSYQASSVTDALRFECEKQRVNIITGTAAQSVTYNNGFTVNTDKGVYRADAVVIASGGSAAPQYFTDGTAYGLLRAFGHSFNKILPSLVQLKTETGKIKALKGIKRVAALRVKGKSRIYSGEVLFTEYGISGNAVFAMSGDAVREFDADGGADIIIDFIPDYSLPQLEQLLEKRLQNNNFKLIEQFFTGILNKQIGKAVFETIGINNMNESVSALSVGIIKKLAYAVKNFELKMTGTTGFKNAQTTIGGARLNEFGDNLESKKQKGLFACGEILDVDGDCGGYNLLWAWISGITAAKGAAEYLNKL